METRNVGIGRALGWERTPDGVEFRCVTEGLAAARVAVSAVAPRAIRVRITAGALPAPKGFTYVVQRPAPGTWRVDADGGRVTVRTEHLVVEATLEPWQLAFRTPDGRLLTHEVADDVNFAGHRLGPRPGFEAESLPQDPLRRAVATVENLLLDPDDHFFGGGEKFTRLDLVGRTIRIWNRNSYGSRSELTYKNIPVLVGTRGYGLFVDVPTAVTFHLGNRSLRTYTVEAVGPELDYYVLAGTPREILTAYTDLTGRPAVVPEWAFGLWASTCFVKFTETSVLEQARRLRAEGIPCDVMHLDSFWQRALMWCDFEWDAERLADPKRLLQELHRQGFHNCLWINPYVSLQSALYQEGAARGYFLRRPDSTVYDALVWSQRTERGMGLCAIVDFTNPEAVAWYRGKLEAQLALGADSFKPDFAEEIPEDARFANGLTGAEMHNPYPLLYQRVAFEATSAHHAGRAVAWSRSAAPGVQRYPGHWAGDSECTFADLASTLRGGLAAAMSGLAYWSHDIGGFWGDPSPELFVRWAQCGFLSALSRYHGATPRDPWLFGEEALAIFREYARLRSRLVPYLASYGHEAAETGMPLHAAHGARVSRRSGRVRLRPSVLPGPGAARLAGRSRRRPGDDLSAARPLARLVERRRPVRAAGAAARGAAARAAALPAGGQPAGARPRAEPRGGGAGRPAHRGGLRRARGPVRPPRRRRPRGPDLPAGRRPARLPGQRRPGYVRAAGPRCGRAGRGHRRRPGARPPRCGGARSGGRGLDGRWSRGRRQGPGAGDPPRLTALPGLVPLIRAR